MTHKELFLRSREIILSNQHPRGGYIASPEFPNYKYCWFRDGAYISHAALLAGEPGSARRFHEWAGQTVVSRKKKLAEALKLKRAGNPVPSDLHLQTRYTLDGREGTDPWENFQLDGWGTWLWALGRFSSISGERLPDVCLEAAEILVSYLEEFWAVPCYDCWEEFRDEVHVYTLSCIFAGLKTARETWGMDSGGIEAKILQRVRERGTVAGYLRKFEGSGEVDASLLGVSVPNGLLAPDDPVMMKTAGLIEQDLLREGGVHRYRQDTYYGGGIWLLLRGWLGLYQLKCGQADRAREALEWMRLQADVHGNLPEQTSGHLWKPEMKPIWEKKWGISASPLLWSHAVYIWLSRELEPYN